MKTVWLVEPSAGQTGPQSRLAAQLATQLKDLGYDVVTRRPDTGVDAALVPIDAVVALDVPTVALGSHATLLGSQGRTELTYLVETGAGAEGLGKAFQGALQPARAALVSTGSVLDDVAVDQFVAKHCTPREIETVLLRMQGLSIEETAERLTLTPKTVKVHTTNACAKFGVHGVSKLRQIIFPIGPQESAPVRRQSRWPDRLPKTATNGQHELSRQKVDAGGKKRK